MRPHPQAARASNDKGPLESPHQRVRPPWQGRALDGHLPRLGARVPRVKRVVESAGLKIVGHLQASARHG